MKTKNTALNKDIYRSIVKSRKRFFAVMIIVALGVTMLTGIYATCQDMYLSADQFYDAQNLFDIQIFSTLGLTNDDILALEEIEEIAIADGGYSASFQTAVGNDTPTVEVYTISEKGLNMPHLLEGALPQKSDEIAVTQKYMDDTGKQLGDTLIIEERKTDDDLAHEPDADEESTPILAPGTYHITAVVLSPLDISNNNLNFRSTTNIAYRFYLSESAADSEVYTAIYLQLTDTTALNSYSSQYEQKVDAVIQKIETNVMNQRQEARYLSVYQDARQEISDAEDEANAEFAEAEQKLAEAWQDIQDARQELEDGEATLREEETSALQQLADAHTELENGRKELLDSQALLLENESALTSGEAELAANEQKLNAGQQELDANREAVNQQFAEAETTLAAAQAALDHNMAELTAAESQLKAAFGEVWPAAEWDALILAASDAALGRLTENPDSPVDPEAIAALTHPQQMALTIAIQSIGSDELNAVIGDCIKTSIGLGIATASEQVLSSQIAEVAAQKSAAIAQLDTAQAEINTSRQQLDAAKQTLANNRQELENGKAQLTDGFKKIEDGEAELALEEADALQQIEDAKKELADGRKELEDGEAEYKTNEEEYLEKKTEAEEKIADAYAALDDIDMAQWYVQDRSSLSSFSDMKNDMSSIEAIGTFFPVIFLLVAVLVTLTTISRMVEEDRGLIGTYMALGFGNGANYKKYLTYALLACVLGGVLGDLLGFIVLPEILYVILQSMYVLPQFYLSFDALYGIGGVMLFAVSISTATVLTCRSSLKQMPAALMRPKSPKSGSRVFVERIPAVWNRLKFLNKVTVRNLFRYKKRLFMTVFGIMGCTALVLTGFAIKDSVAALMTKQYEQVYQYDLLAVSGNNRHEEMLDVLSPDIKDAINIRIENVKVINSAGESETIQMFVIPDASRFKEYISLTDSTGNAVSLDDEGALLTINASIILEVNAGDRLQLQTMELDRYELGLSGIVENYLGNTIYLTQDFYESIFGEYHANATLAFLSDEIEDPIQYAKDLPDNDVILSASSTTQLKTDFAKNFSLLNYVVYILIFLAAGLAFAVLFTLSNTNISERARELATIKVLGLFDHEVHSYINKETLILTLIGVVAGLPFGYVVSELLMAVLKLPGIYFTVSITPLSFVISAAISFGFAVIVNLITNRSLDKINMVEALKSVE